MISDSIRSLTNSLRTLLLLALCASLASLSACKKKEEASAAAPTGDQPAEQPAEQPKEEKPKEEQAFELKPKWPTGQRMLVQLTTHTDTEISNPALPQPVKTENFLTQEIAFTASPERPTGGCEVEVEVVSVRSESKAAGKVTPVFDPKGDPKQDAKLNQAGPAFRKLIGSKVKYQTGPDNAVTRVDGVPQLMNKLNTGLSFQAQFMIRTLVSEDSIRGWNALHQNLPTNAVKVGDTWESTRDIPFGVARFVMISTNTFKGWEQRNDRKLAKIETAGVIAPKEGVQSAITLGEGATVAGDSRYDPTLGVVIESDATAQFTVSVPQASGQATSSKLRTRVTSKLTDAGGAAVSAVAPAPADAKPADKQ